MIQIKNGSFDISSLVSWPSTQLSIVLTKEVARLQFDVIYNLPSGEPTHTPQLGDVINVYEDSNLIFAGNVTESSMSIDGGFKARKSIHCTDWSYYLDGKLVHKNYSNMDPKDIVIDIIGTFASGKGFTTSNVQKGNFIIPTIKFNYEQPTKCIEKLAKMIGWEWYVDPNKDIHFFLQEGTVAPYNIDDTGGNIEWQTIDVGKNLQNMKNSVYVIGANYKKTFTSVNTIDIYQTDGIRQTFTLAYNYDFTNIKCSLGGVLQSIGRDQVDDPASHQVMFNDKGRFIFFNSIPTTGQTVKVYGDALIPILAHASDAVGISLYGEYQDVIVDKKISSVQEAQSRAQAEILQFGHAVNEVKFKTLKTGWKIGQTILLNSSIIGITNLPLIIKNITAIGYSPFIFEYDITCLGSDKVTFVDLMSNILRAEATQNPVDDSTVGQDLEVLPQENLTMQDTVTATAVTASTFKWGYLATQSFRFEIVTALTTGGRFVKYKKNYGVTNIPSGGVRIALDVPPDVPGTLRVGLSYYLAGAFVSNSNIATVSNATNPNFNATDFTFTSTTGTFDELWITVSFNTGQSGTGDVYIKNIQLLDGGTNPILDTCQSLPLFTFDSTALLISYDTSQAYYSLWGFSIWG